VRPFAVRKAPGLRKRSPDMILTYEDYLDYCEATDTYPLDPDAWQQEEDEAQAERLIHNKEIDDGVY